MTHNVQIPSTFAQMVDRLKHKSEDELKLLYLKFFENELNDEWKKITEEVDFADTSEDDIIKVLQKKRHKQNVTPC